MCKTIVSDLRVVLFHKDTVLGRHRHMGWQIIGLPMREAILSYFYLLIDSFS